MKEVDDVRWRQAASTLGLELVDAAGRTITPKRATRANSMRGSLNGRELIVRYARGSTIIDVRLAKSLKLGAKVQVSAPPNRRFAGPGQTVITGIEPERINHMLTRNQPGRDLMATLESLGSLGWVQLTDTRIQTQSEIYVEAPEEYVDLVRKVSGAALHAEAAREKLAPAEWETDLRHRLEAAAAELHLEVAQKGFFIHGLVRRAQVSLELLATDHYFLSGHVRFTRQMPADTLIERRHGTLSGLAAILGLDKPTVNVQFNMAFRVRGNLHNHITADTINDILKLAGDGEFRVDRLGATYKTRVLTANVAEIIMYLVRISERLVGNSKASPYR